MSRWRVQREVGRGGVLVWRIRTPEGKIQGAFKTHALAMTSAFYDARYAARQTVSDPTARKSP